jgi:hypothetical protein
MKKFKCGNCESVVFFENTACVTCGDVLGFVPETLEMASFTIDKEGKWHRHTGRQSDRLKPMKPCSNYTGVGVCNWMLPADDPESLCWSCQYTEIIPALNKAENVQLWYLLEAAKRRLFYTLYALNFPVPSRRDQSESGLIFHFKEDTQMAGDVLTGHDSGLITLNITEADDVEREARRKALNEPYRTLLGHFRHESGHFYWDQLIKNSKWLNQFRVLFGDERTDYQNALQKHYQEDVTKNWENNFVSIYASTHPWEDWAETWAHYLLIIDGLDTAEHWQLSIGSENVLGGWVSQTNDEFNNVLMTKWMPIAQFLNTMNRSLGNKDSYPFLLSDKVVQKLSFINSVVGSLETN